MPNWEDTRLSLRGVQKTFITAENHDDANIFLTVMVDPWLDVNRFEGDLAFESPIEQIAHTLSGGLEQVFRYCHSA